MKGPDIIFEDEHLLAVNKPPGLLTIPDRYNDNLPSLYKLLEQKYPKIFIVHRLDKDTSGLILFAKDENTHKYLSQLFEHRKVEKYYLGIVTGKPYPDKGIIDEPIAENTLNKLMMVVAKRGKPSITEYEVIEDYGQYSLVRFLLQTGRTHQIRLHMKHIGHPLACDEFYGNGNAILLSSIKKKYKLSASEEEERPILNRLALHSYQLIFQDQQGRHHDLKAELPKDMRAFLNQLKKNKR